MTKLFQFLREVKSELFKVVWPSRQETIKMTMIVIVFSVVVAAFLGAVDYGLIKLVELAFK
jgi:preprotein translocase subunit SecE